MTDSNNDQFNLGREINLLKGEKVNTRVVLETERDKYARLLNGSMGEDIDNVLSGRVKVTLSFRERVKYKIRWFFDLIFRIF